MTSGLFYVLRTRVRLGSCEEGTAHADVRGDADAAVAHEGSSTRRNQKTNRGVRELSGTKTLRSIKR